MSKGNVIKFNYNGIALTLVAKTAGVILPFSEFTPISASREHLSSNDEFLQCLKGAFNQGVDVKFDSFILRE